MLKSRKKKVVKYAKKSVTTLIPPRITKEELRQKITDFCYEWKTLQVIADYLRRTKTYRIKILPQMSDVLQMRFSKENHP